MAYYLEIEVNNSECPHCRVVVHFDFKAVELAADDDGQWYARSAVCPSCDRIVVHLTLKPRPRIILSGEPDPASVPPRKTLEEPCLVWPRHKAFTPAVPAVSKKLAEDYNEARLILDLSPKASAALARRCLQNFIRDHVGIKERDLSTEIQKLLDGGEIPSYIAGDIDAIRQVGNFAAHPIKDQNTGMVTEVEPGEAGWILDVLERMFDFYFVQQEKARDRRKALNQKLADSGKPPLKQVPRTPSD